MEVHNTYSENIAAARLNEVQTINTNKKISFISAILLIISSCIGSGIFFKSSTVLTLNWGSFILSITSWVVSAIAVICMAIALIEVSSKGNDNLSLIGWTKRFNSKFIYKCCKNFMFYIFMPLEYFYLPYFAIISIQNMLKGFGVNFNFGTENDWAIWMLIGVCMSSWFIFSSGINTKIADIQNKIILSLKFIPLVVVVILGFVIIGFNGVSIQFNPELQNDITPTTFYQLWPGIGTILALSAIFFSFDGFYFAAGIQKEMKEPKKTPKAIIIGLLIVTFIYLLIAIVMTLASKTGSFNGDSGYEHFLKNHGLSWLFAVLNLLIAISVMGTLNGFTTWGTRLVEELIVEHEVPFANQLINKINSKKPIIGALYVFILSTIVMVIFSTIGGLSYIPIDYLDENGFSLYDAAGFSSSAKLYTFANLMSNWTSIFAFTFIVCAICGCLKNRKTNKIDVIKNKYFKSTAIVAILVVGASLILTVIQPFADLFLINNLDNQQYLISKIMLIVVLLLFIFFMVFPYLIEKIKYKYIKNKYK